MSGANHLSIVILAAGQGSRMKSSLPKVLHPLAGKPLLKHVLDSANLLSPSELVVVYGHGGGQVRDAIKAKKICWVEQKDQKGTGHAVQQAMPQLDDDRIVLILYGDVPLISEVTLSDLVKQVSDSQMALLTVHLNNPAGYGRIVRDAHGHVQAIVEEKDASDEQRKITEINTGIMAVRADKLRQWLANLQNDNAQAEYYLTDIIAMAANDGVEVIASHPSSEEEVMGINSRSQLAQLERYFQRQQAETLMTKGVTVSDPDRIDIRGTVSVGRDIVIDANVILEGEVNIGDNVVIGSNCVLRNCTLESGVEILPMSIVEEAVIGRGSRVGPFARLRPGARLEGDNHIGNFVEIKNSNIGLGSKVNHLTYIGDTDMGSGVNIGAGTITANYDGANKHRTTIENNASTGSNSVLVAPIKIGEGATIGAGTVLRKDAPAGELTLTASKQKTVVGWKRPTKK